MLINVHVTTITDLTGPGSVEALGHMLLVEMHIFIQQLFDYYY